MNRKCIPHWKNFSFLLVYILFYGSKSCLRKWKTGIGPLVDKHTRALVGPGSSLMILMHEREVGCGAYLFIWYPVGFIKFLLREFVSSSWFCNRWLNWVLMGHYSLITFRPVFIVGLGPILLCFISVSLSSIQLHLVRSAPFNVIQFNLISLVKLSSIRFSSIWPIHFYLIQFDPIQFNSIQFYSIQFIQTLLKITWP